MLNGLFGGAYATPDEAKGACWIASNKLVRWLRGFGLDARLVSCEGFLGDASEFHQWYEDNNFTKDGKIVGDYFGHWMVRVGGTYIDLTARQFFPDANHPQVYDEVDMDGLWEKYEDSEQR